MFTDIEGSTSLWDLQPDAMSAAQSIHDRILYDVIETAGGYVFSQAGDGFAASFSSAIGGVGAALDIQRKLASQEWPDGIERISVRIGVHVGVAEERDGDYFGTTVNRAARVSAAGRGDQILLTDATRSLIVDVMPQDWHLMDLGERRLRDLARPERLWLIESEQWRPTRRELRSVSRPGNLRPPRRAVVGRDDLIAAVAGRLDSDRLVTLVGVGGVGKTTLAQAAAESAAIDVPGGKWFVDLSVVSDPAAVPAAVATALEIVMRPGMDAIGSTVDALRAGRRLLVLDNAEQVVGGVAALVDRLLGDVPDVSIIVTSREPLDIDGEVVVSVDPLDVTGGKTAPAVELFVQRAERVALATLRTADELETIARICRRLEGIPLAIELAASQCDVFTPEQIEQRLAESGIALESAWRSGPDRHRSLVAAIDWSYRSLDEATQRVFDRLSVFAGGSTVEAVEEVCCGDEGGQGEVSRSLRTLVRKSLVTLDRTEATIRVRLLEPLRDFAAARLADRRETGAAAARHAAYYARIGAEAVRAASGPEEARRLRTIIADLDNLGLALRFAVADRHVGLLRDLGPVIMKVIESGIGLDPGDWVQPALEILPPDDSARLGYAGAWVLVEMQSGDHKDALVMFDAATQGIAALPAVDAQRRRMVVVTALLSGDIDTAIAEGPEAVARAEASGLTDIAMATKGNLALALHFSGATDEARRYADELAAQAEQAGSASALGWARYTSGEMEPEPDTAIDLFEESLEHAASIGDKFRAGLALVAIAGTAGRSGNTAAALDAIERGLGLWSETGNRIHLWTAIRNLVELLHGLGLDEDACVLDAAAAHAPQAPGLFGPHGDRYRTVVGDIEDSLGPAAERLQVQGAEMSYHDVISFASDAVRRARMHAGAVGVSQPVA
jgi:predicted ATPase/class 3 adenylate cyclase